MNVMTFTLFAQNCNIHVGCQLSSNQRDVGTASMTRVNGESQVQLRSGVQRFTPIETHPAPDSDRCPTAPTVSMPAPESDRIPSAPTVSIPLDTALEPVVEIDHTDILVDEQSDVFYLE